MIKCVSCKTKKRVDFDVCVHVYGGLNDILIFDRQRSLIMCKDCYIDYEEGHYRYLIIKPICFDCLLNSIKYSLVGEFEHFFFRNE